MDADFAVELGRDDETLEIPWATPDGGPRYIDLKRHPELLDEIDEACREPALREFLLAANAADGPFETAKCDVWHTSEINPEEEIHGFPLKFGCYVDLLFSDGRRTSFPQHEYLAKKLVELLRRVPEIPASAEILIRRAFFRDQDSTEGCYFTIYVFGFGDDEESAHKQWVIGLKLLENALRQVARSMETPV